MSEAKKILIVDDEEDLCSVLAWDFEDEGFEVFKAFNGNSALEILKDNTVDILISDIKMPNGDGIFLLEEMKNRNISVEKIFLMTGFSDYPEDRLTSLGVLKLFKKPIDTDVILEVIEGA